MRRIFGKLFLLVAAGSISVSVVAQTVVLSDDFEGHAVGAFGNAYNFGDSGAAQASSIVSPGAGGVGKALQFSANLHNGTNANTGVNLPAYSPAGNISANLSDY